MNINETNNYPIESTPIESTPMEAKDTTVEKKRELPVPNELHIMLHTSIPGFQKIKYIPSMTIENVDKDNKKLYFDPLIKYNENVIAKTIPADLKLKQFFNSGLFASFIRSLNSSPVKNIQQSKYDGIVDHNINAVIKNLFEDNTVITINGKPYVITGFNWTTGDWKIDTKTQKQQLDSSQITNPVLYMQTIEAERVQGEEQLRELEAEDKKLIYGNNYDGPIIDIPMASVSQVPINVTQVQPVQPAQPAQPVVPLQISNDVANKQIADQPQLQLSITEKGEEKENKVEELPGDDIVNIKQPTVVTETRPQQVDPKYEIGKTNEKSTKLVKDKLKLLTSISQNLFNNNEDNVKIREMINKTLNNDQEQKVNSTNKSLARKVFINICDKLRIIENEAGGECFFIAVAQGINYHNRCNAQNLVKGGTYCNSSNQYTTQCLRDIVYDYIMEQSQSTLFEIQGTANAIELNKIFSERSQDENNLTTINNIIEDIYNDKNNENFLVKKILLNKNDDIQNFIPFKVFSQSVEEESIKKYILSPDYWGDENAINAIENKLKLKIIVFSIEEQKIRINLNLNEEDKSSKGKEEFNKCLFLYFNNKHYELMFFERKNESKDKGKIQTIVFDRCNGDAIINRNVNDPSEHKYPHMPFYMYVIFYIYFYTSTINPTYENYLFPTFTPIFNYFNNNLCKLNPTQYKSFLFNINENIEFSKNYKQNLDERCGDIPRNIDPMKLKNPIEPAEIRKSKRIYDRGPGSNITGTMDNEDNEGIINTLKVEKSSTEDPKLDDDDIVLLQQINSTNNSNIKDTTLITDKINKMINHLNNLNDEEDINTSNRENNMKTVEYLNETLTKMSQRGGEIITKPRETSKLAYYIDVYLELHPGTTISPEQLKKSKCSHQLNIIKQTCSTMLGKKYTQSQDYSLLPTATNPSKNDTENTRVNNDTVGGRLRKNRNTKKKKARQNNITKKMFR